MQVVIVGGGLGGLVAAAGLARRGVRTTLLERARELGGRGRTQRVSEGFLLNQGPHALYAGMAGARVLGELGIEVRGGAPSVRGRALAGGRDYALPAGPGSLLTTGLLGWKAKLEVGGLLARLPRLDPAEEAGTSWRSWTERNLSQPESRALLEALGRLTTYVHDPERLDAALALSQLQGATTRGVLYLDGGWAQLVEALRTAALAAGAHLRTGSRVEALRTRAAETEATEPRFEVELADGERLPASHVVLAVGPRVAERLSGASLLDPPPRPIHAACLDVALERLPRRGPLFALGIDEPLYYSVHSAAARLAPGDGAVVHVARYLGPRDDGAEAAPRLEALLDQLQPGWREQLVERRFLPRMLVAHDCPTAERGGLGGRPPVAVAERRGLYCVGDWVGPEGWLADGSLASASQAVEAILAESTRPADQATALA